MARKQRKLDKEAVAHAASNSRVVEFMAAQAAARTQERAAFEAQCAARLQAEAERKAAEAVRTSMRAPPEDRWRIAPRWWLDSGGTQERWEEERAERYRRNADAQTPRIRRPVRLSRRHRPLLSAVYTRTVSDAASSSVKCVTRAFALSALLSVQTGGRVTSAPHCSSALLRSVPDMCSECLAAGPPPEREVDVRSSLGPEEAVVQASEEELVAYAHGYVDYGDVHADPY